MPRRILILDDDSDFNSLLTDVFSQANYEVKSFGDPLTAVKAAAEGSYELVISDFKMPGMTGLEFVRALRKQGYTAPIIIVSGYLDNDTIRQLIRENVGGIFLKPLNIFNLLKKTNELIEKAEKDKAEAAKEAAAEKESLLPFEFTSFAGRAPKAVDFANKLFAARTGKNHLVFIGGEGSPFRAVCRDLVNFAAGKDELVELNADNVNAPVLFRQLKTAQDKGAERVVLALIEGETLPNLDKGVIFAAARKEGAFKALTIATRLAVCFRQTMDELYEAGTLPEDVFLFLGSAQEMTVPSLAACSDDIPVLTKRLLKGLATEKNLDPVPALEDAGRAYLMAQKWPGNHEELRVTLLAALAMADKGVIRTPDLQYAYEFKSSRQAGFRVEPLRDYLTRARRDYLAAVGLLCGGDATKAGEVMGLDPKAAQAFLVLAGDNLPSATRPPMKKLTPV